MILNLAEKRTMSGRLAAGGDWVSAHWSLLEALAVPVGPSSWSVDLVLVDEGRMTQLNQGFREVAGVTDVLSFSYLLETGDQDPDLAEGSSHAACDLWLDRNEVSETGAAGGLPLIGEIILAPDFVAARCAANGWQLGLEFPMLVVHGLLHILGWDHVDQDERTAMQEIEESILASEKLTHPMRQRS